MSGAGNWIIQNKIRPGAYINFKPVLKSSMTLGERGVVTFPTPMSWGKEGELIKISGEDLLAGKSIPKIGIDASGEESLVFRQGLSYCQTAYVYRLDKGGQAAVGTLELPDMKQATVSAQCNGVLGNQIQVEVIENVAPLNTFTINTFFSGRLVDSQVITTMSDFENNDFILITYGTDVAPIPVAGITLAGGTNGTIDTTLLPEYFGLLDRVNFQTMAMPFPVEGTLIQELIAARIKLWRKSRGKYVQAVVYDSPADYEGIINVKQGFTTVNESIDKSIFTATVASMTAGAAVNQSNTARKVIGAVSIIGELDDEEIKEEIQKGTFLLSREADDSIVVETDINSLVTMTPDVSNDYKKNRLIRVFDAWGETVQRTWDTKYKGKVDNNEAGRSGLKLDLIVFGRSMEGLNAIQNFAAADIEVFAGDDKDAVRADVSIEGVDAMEKLYMNIFTR